MASRPVRLALAAAVAAAALVAGPPPQATRAADDGLLLTSVASYEILPDEERVAVTVDLTATNTSPDTTVGGFVTQYWFDVLPIAIQPEAAGVSATSGGRRLDVEIVDHRRYDRLDVRLAEPIYFDQTARVRLRYELPAGKPRSSSDVRVGAAFATFVAWSFGDSGRVRIEVPEGFAVSTSGSALERDTADGVTVLTAGPIGDPAGWYSVVDARRDDALTTERLSIPSGEAVVVRGWPEDEEWVDRVGEVLSSGLPTLGELIGLDWPVTGELTVVEVHTALLEGYGGFYDTVNDTITVSEDLDGHVILHEAAHAWFNGELFAGRWIGEGLADQYADLVVRSTGGAGEAPRAIDPADRVAFPLVTWRDPAPIVDEATAAYEAYGYDASWTVVRELVERAGVDGMRAVMQAAAAREIPYRGEGPPERLTAVPDWTRLLDLVEERTEAVAADLFRAWVVDDAGARLLDVRADARAAYDELIEAGDGWQPPYAVRAPMASWQFSTAMAQIEGSQQVLAMRDEIEQRAAALGLEVPPGLESAYETASSDVAAAVPVARQRLNGLAQLESGMAAVSAPRDLFAELGLLTETLPEERLDEAKDAFESGRFDLAATRVGELLAILAAAPGVGRGRLAIGGSVIVLVVLAIAALAVIRRRRQDRPEPVPIGVMATGTLPPTSPGESAGTTATEPATGSGDGPTDSGRLAPG